MTGLKIRRISSAKGKLLATLAVVSVLAIQPLYGLAASHSVLAEDGTSSDSSIPDTVKPEVALLSPTVTSFDSTDTDIVVKATDDRGLSKVVANIYKGGSLYKSTQSAGGGATEFTHTVDLAALQGIGLMPVGDYSVKYNAVDQAGNTSATKTYAFTVVDKVKPSATLATPTVHGPVNTDLVTLQVDATDDRGLNKIVANIYQGNVLYKSTQSAVGGAKNGTHTKSISLPDGVYTIRYNASDQAGNISATGSFEYIVDTTAPETPLLETPVDGATVTVSSFWFDWADVTDAASYEIQFSQSNSTDLTGSLNTNVWSGDANGNQPSESRAWSAGATGTWYWQVRAVDAAGNKSAWSAPWGVTITPDTTSTEEPPIVTPTDPVDPKGTTPKPPTTGSGSSSGIITQGSGARTIEPQQLIAISGLQPSNRAAVQFAQLNPSGSGSVTAVDNENTSTITTPSILGTSDISSDPEEPEVKGAATEKGWFAGILGFWWILPLLAVFGFFWWFVATRRARRQEDRA